LHVEDAASLEVGALRGHRVAGLTAGTSTLDRTLDEVHDLLTRIP
jgi:4-hydroxy-3-methylbut-2-enyl diphosphate reductase IspH